MESSTLFKLRRFMPRLLALGSALALIAGVAGVSDAQVTFSKMLNNTVSDPLGGFFDPDPNSPIAIDGNSIVFRNLGLAGPEMWSSDLAGSNLTNLANRSSLSIRANYRISIRHRRSRVTDWYYFPLTIIRAY
jgi:hypothetical protein